MKEHSAKLAILKQLADGDFHSGEVLGAQLGSREQPSVSIFRHPRLGCGCVSCTG